MIPPKKPIAAGSFYPSDPTELAKLLETLLHSTSPSPLENIALLLLPHAGYAYSGKIAAAGWKAVSHRKLSTIILIGVSHFYRFSGIAQWPGKEFLTPLGPLSLDSSLSPSLPFIRTLQEPFLQEHSIEVQLPFIQKLFPYSTVLPLLTGELSLQECEEFAQALTEILANRKDILVVVTSDLSHYHPLTQAIKLDTTTLLTLWEEDPRSLYEKAQAKQCELCGLTGILIALYYARKNHLDGRKILAYSNSSHTSLDTHRVVGYACMAFWQESFKQALLQLAQKALQAALEKTEFPITPDPLLERKEGVFITLYKEGKLRGCVGLIESTDPLYYTIAHMTQESTQDPRFPPLQQEDLGTITIHISLLSPLAKIASIDDYHPRIHGIVLSYQGKKGVFLPEVAEETHWTKEQLLSQLCQQKLHLPSLAWQDPQAELYTFVTERFD